MLFNTFFRLFSTYDSIVFTLILEYMAFSIWHCEILEIILTKNFYKIT